MRRSVPGLRAVVVLALILVANRTVGEPSPGAFLTAQDHGAWVASRAIGTTVVTSENETVGDVSDVIIGGDGRAIGLVIGVGGFLGLGEKTVAVTLDRVEMGPLSLGAAALTGEAVRTPDKVVLHATRDELRGAPEFKPVGRPLPKLPGFGPSPR